MKPDPRITLLNSLALGSLYMCWKTTDLVCCLCGNVIQRKQSYRVKELEHEDLRAHESCLAAAQAKVVQG